MVKIILILAIGILIGVVIACFVISPWIAKRIGKNMMNPFFEEDKMKEPFDADLINPKNWVPILRVRKKPIIIHAIQLNFPEGFDVTTMEGKLHGQSGDYLIIGVNDEKYPCAKEIFEKTYDVIDEEK